MMNTNERESALAVLLKSDAMRSALAAEDSKRMAAHQAAVDALLAHEAGGGELEAAAAGVEDARAKLAPIEAKFRTAAQAVALAESTLRDMQWRRDHHASRLRREAGRHVPPIVNATEGALYFVANDIGNRLDVWPSIERDWKGATLTRYESNRPAIDAALGQVQVIRDLIYRFMLEPKPAGEIIETLSTEAAILIDLAKACGAMVAHHLPAEIRPAYFEKPERLGPYYPRAA
jgi:hypothetical protein